MLAIFTVPVACMLLPQWQGAGWEGAVTVEWDYMQFLFVACTLTSALSSKALQHN